MMLYFGVSCDNKSFKISILRTIPLNSVIDRPYCIFVMYTWSLAYEMIDYVEKVGILKLAIVNLLM